MNILEKLKGVVKVNNKKMLKVLLVTVLMSIFPTQVWAATTREDSIKEESAQISTEIDQALTSVNQTYKEIESLKQNVTKTESKISKLKENITTVETSIEKRVDAMGKRMQSLQVNNASATTDLLDTLLDAEGVSDFISRLHAVNVIQDAEHSKVESLTADKEKLEKLKENLDISQTTLVEKQESLQTEKAQLETKVGSLKEELSSNKEALKKLETTRLAKEAVEQKKQAQAAEKASLAVSDKKEMTEPNESVTPTAPKGNATSSIPKQPDATVSGGGQTMTMEATGYSYTQAGLSFYTATGIDLRVNPKVIAVDPNVIPLNSLVEVSGYGFAIAGDTGGDIKGNRVDLHFNSVAECMQFGRRSVTVTVK